MRRFTLLRRLAVFVMTLALLGLSGLGLLLFRWQGERGAPPAGRLYVHGDFATDGALAVLEEAGSSCYSVEVSGAPRTDLRLCRGQPVRVWVDDGLLDLELGTGGGPRLSIAGLRARDGDWLGSLADRRREHPRFPLRAYGVPALAARVVPCPAADLCLEVHDRLGRLARLGAEDGRSEILRRGERYPLHEGDVLWLGLVAFEVRVEDDGTALVLERVDRLRPHQDGGVRRAADRGGDRRWLGRLWHAELPDPSPAVPERFEIHPMRVRYTAHNLSRQRTSFEGEDVLQRLIDGGWLCLEPGELEVAWRPLERPGCDAPRMDLELTPSAREDYRRARSGDLSHLAAALTSAANDALARGRYLDDATVLPFAFDWRLARRAGDELGDDRPPRPVPHRLWGVRFSATRQIRRSPSSRRRRPPEIRPRATTARHLVQVLNGDRLAASFYLPAVARRGSICLGRHAGQAEPYRPTSGSHHPLGSVALASDPREGTWSPDPDAACDGCRLLLQAGDDGSKAALTWAGQCPLLEPGPAADEVRWGPYRLRRVDRGQPWLAATDPGTGQRHFAEEFYLLGGLRPLLGDEAALSGVEAALRKVLEDARQTGAEPAPEPLELTVDGDLQLTAAAIVDALARPEIAAGDAEPDRVSVTAVIVDARDGDLLAAVNWSSRGSQRGRLGAGTRPTAWELGSGQADVLENAALRRRGAIGSTMKITGSYALLNNRALVPGAEIARRRRGVAFLEAGGDGRIFLARDAARERPSPRNCSTGPHYLPAGDGGFTTGTFVRRFAASCNNFFVLTGLRHAGSRPARLRERAAAGRDELAIDVRRTGAVLSEPADQPLVERIRDGLEGDFADDTATDGAASQGDAAAPKLPRSLFGVLFRLGFQPRPDPLPGRGAAPAELALDHRGRRVAVPLVHDWFSPAAGAATPALRPGRDFTYPGVPSPGRLDQATVQGAAVTEHYEGVARPVKRRAEGRADVQYAMLMIGQSSVEVSALGLATLYAPAARDDGRAVSPCLFRANCGAHRAGARVIESAAAGVLNEALRAVVRYGTARGGLRRIGLEDFSQSGWGGKTGTYQVERRQSVGLSAADWRRLRAWACGVEGVRPPRIRAAGSRSRALASALAAAPAGSALGARACEVAALNPAGVHRYRRGPGPRQLDELARELARTAERRTETYHSFVALAPPPRGSWPGAEQPATGLVVAVLVDRQTRDKSVAVKIGGELAAAAERWAVLSR